MLIGLTIRDVVLIEALELEVGAGLTVLTGETGAGKSILLDALGLALGRRADQTLVRRGAAQAHATALFAPPAGHPAYGFLEEKGFPSEPGEPISLRRQLGSDGRSRAFINDQPAGAAVLRDLGALLLEIHGQHETVGLLDARTHRGLLDQAAETQGPARETAQAWRRFAETRTAADSFEERISRAMAEREERAVRLAELDRLNPQPGEEAALHEERALLGAAEKALADIEAARAALGDDQIRSRLAAAHRALERARDRTLQAGAAPEGEVAAKLSAAADAVDRALVEALEAEAAIEAAGRAFEFEPDRLEKAEERLFALRAAARRLGVAVDDLPLARADLAGEMSELEGAAVELRRLRGEQETAFAAYQAAARGQRAARQAAAERLSEAVMAELGPLKLERARFRVSLVPVPPDRLGPSGLDQIEFQIATNPGSPFAALGAVASGGELARIALALKAALAARGEARGPVMIFDEVDQGVGGAVADAVGLRLKRLSRAAQVILVTHSPQIAARADAHWKVEKAEGASGARTRITPLPLGGREEEIARMLSGAEITEAARAAARALIDA